MSRRCHALRRRPSKNPLRPGRVSRLLLLGVSLITATGAFTGEVQRPIYGTWDLFEVQGNGMTAQVRLTVEAHSVVNATTCSYDGKRVDVAARASARITADAIEVLEDRKAEKAYAPGFLNCAVSLDKGTIHYEMVGDHLVIRVPGEDRRMELSRSGSLFRSARLLAGHP